MTGRAEEEPTSSAAFQKSDRAGRQAAQAEPHEIGPAPRSESNGIEPPSIDEIRLRAYYRYMERDGDPDELADWLEAESELRERAEAGRAEGRRGEQP
jgi:Protein of unknown function (DUF2934)